jgi:hypothetical protein
MDGLKGPLAILFQVNRDWIPMPNPGITGGKFEGHKFSI